MGLYYRVTKQSAKRQKQEPVFSIQKSESNINFAYTFPSRILSRKSFIQSAIKICHYVILLNVYLTIFNNKTTDFLKSVLFQIAYILFCFPKNECSVYYLQTNQKHLKSFYLTFFLFLSHLCDDKLNRSDPNIEISHNLQ